MTQSIVTLGRQPALGIAELESIYGAQSLRPVGTHAVIIDVPPQEINFDRLGGSTRLCKLLTCLDTTDWYSIESYLVSSMPQHLGYIPEGKIKLGISLFAPRASVKAINATALALKKIIKAEGRSVRVIPNSHPELNSAQILHNQLTGPTGLELVCIQDGNQTYLAQTTAAQNINAYAARDQKRPKRDARVGMLPPKLAQIIVNLATGHMQSGTVLDPFCGTGVVLQEALLMGFDTYGTDLEPRMIEYSNTNMAWLADTYSQHPSNISMQTLGKWHTEQGDATTHHWHNFDTVACETYLGRPLVSIPSPDKLTEIIRDCDTIHRKFLQNMAKQTPSATRLCIAVPAWRTNSGFKHLRTLDSLEELGYNRLRFVHARNSDLIYHRPDQVVARELVILERK